MNPVTYRVVLISTVLSASIILTGCSGKNNYTEPSSEQNNISTTAQATESTKKDINGFDERKNTTETVGSYVFSIPKYWKADISENDHYRAYAETSDKVAMLQITSQYDGDDSVTFEILKQETANGSMAKAISTWFDSCGEIQSKMYDNGVIKGYLYTCDFIQDGYTGKAEIFTFPSVSDNCWIYVTLVETDNTKYSYFNDFSKMIESTLDVQTAKLKAIEKYPKTATYTYREGKETARLTINFERQWVSGYASTMNTRTSSYTDYYEGEYPNDLTITKTYSDGETLEQVIKFTGSDRDPSESMELTSTYSSGHIFVDKYKRQSVEW